MRTPSRFSMLCAAAALLCAAAGEGQERVSGIRSSISLQAGYASAGGEWTRHPYAPVSFFRQSLVIGGEVAIPLSDKLVLALNGGYSKLSTSDWDAYAGSMGDQVTSSASLGYLAVVIRPYLKSTAPDLVSIEVGPLLLFPAGSERAGGRSYDYDFMGSPEFGGIAAVEYDRTLGGNYAVYLRVAAIYVPSALQYADGWSPSLTSVPVMVGWRFLF